MFYKSKYLFFVILYCMCACLYYFINKQVILTGFMSGFILGSFVIYITVLFFSFLFALLFSIAGKYVYAFYSGLRGKGKKAFFFKLFWTVFTILCYMIVFIVFFKMIEY